MASKNIALMHAYKYKQHSIFVVCNHEFFEHLFGFINDIDIQQAVPINEDNIPPLWSLPTSSRNIQ